jgi:hypothetical protein
LPNPENQGVKGRPRSFLILAFACLVWHATGGVVPAATEPDLARPATIPRARAAETEPKGKSYHFSATLGDSAALVERVKLIQEELSAFVNERSGRILFVLTLVTVLALPINLVAGLLGMNVGGIPFAESASGFAIIVTLLVLLTAVLGYQVVTRLRD